MLANISIENSTYTIPISLKYYSESGKVYLANTSISINSVVAEPDISVSLLGSMPPTLYSGYNQSIEFVIANSGNGIARNITVTVLPGRNINILSSVRKFFIPALLPGSSINQRIFVSANYTTSANANLIINVTYYSSNYKQNFSKVFNKTIYIMPSAQFQVTGVETQAYPGATNMPVTLTIKNIGNEIAKEIQVSFQSIYPITPINSNAYIERLLPGEEVNVTFVINVDLNGYPGNYPITIFETWKQPNGSPNQLYTGSNNYYIPVYNKPSSSNSTLSGSAIIIGIGLIAIGVLLYFRKKKEKAATKKK
jgi:LPXTG-motif cell wall-anchored protein